MVINIKYLFGLIRSFKDLAPMKKSKILDKHVTTMQSKDITKPSPITAINKPKYVVMTWITNIKLLPHYTVTVLLQKATHTM